MNTTSKATLNKINSAYFIPMILILIAVLAILANSLITTSRTAAASQLVSAEEQRAREVFQTNWNNLSTFEEKQARETFRSNWQALTASGAAAGTSQRAIDAYSARLSGLAMASSNRVNAAYSARLAGLALAAQASAQRAQAADTARWEAQARYYAGQLIPVTGQ